MTDIRFLCPKNHKLGEVAAEGIAEFKEAGFFEMPRCAKCHPLEGPKADNRIHAAMLAVQQAPFQPVWYFRNLRVMWADVSPGYYRALNRGWKKLDVQVPDIGDAPSNQDDFGQG